MYLFITFNIPTYAKLKLSRFTIKIRRLKQNGGNKQSIFSCEFLFVLFSIIKD